MVETPFERKPSRFLSLLSVSNLKHECRYLYMDVSQTLVSVRKEVGRATKNWIPLYLASDVLSIDSTRKCNKSRVHATFAKQGVATKIHLPAGVKLSGVPLGNASGVWFYSVYGVIQAVMQYVEDQAQQIEILEALLDTWKQHIDDPPLPETLNGVEVQFPDNLNLAVPPDLQKIQPLPRENVKHYDRHYETVSSYISATGCIVNRKRLRTGSMEPTSSNASNVPPVAFEVSVSSEPHVEETVTMECGSGDQSSEKLQNHDIPETITGKDCYLRYSKGCQRLDGGTWDTEGSLKKCLECVKHWSFESKECLSKELEKLPASKGNLLKTMFSSLESILHVSEDHTQECFDKSVALILDGILKADTNQGDSHATPFCSSTCTEEVKSYIGNLWESSSLLIISRWIGDKFKLMVPDVIRRVESFKEANVNQISELPSDRELIAQLFPPAMSELFYSWMDLRGKLSSPEVLSKSDGDEDGEIKHTYCHGQNQDKPISKGTYSLLLLLLEFSNQALVSGVAHVLYPRFVDV